VHNITCTQQHTTQLPTHVHKITNVPVFYMELKINGFEAGKSIFPKSKPLRAAPDKQQVHK
jgi:hypothetical protein